MDEAVIPPAIGEDLAFREVTSEVVSSTCVVGKRVLREYSSEFILPDDTKIAVGRREVIFPTDGEHQVIVTLSAGLPDSANTQVRQFQQYCYHNKDINGLPVDTTDTDTSITSHEYSQSGNESSGNQHSPDEDSKEPKGLRIADYVDDDPWAASMLDCDADTEGDLLRQLEAGCRLKPEAYTMQRVQRKRNHKAIIELQKRSQVRNIGLDPTHSDSDSVETQSTDVENLG